MPDNTVSKRINRAAELAGPFLEYLNSPGYTQNAGKPEFSDFIFGNPHEMPLEDFSQALMRWSQPQNKDWFAYKMSEPGSQKIIAESLSRRMSLPFQPEDIAMTNGAFAAIAVALGAILDPGDEVIVNLPPWFFYEALVGSYYGEPVRVRCDPQTHDLDLSAIARAITSRTRAIIVNTPNNPTGKIYPPETLAQLGDLLTQASRRNERTIYLLSDESYNHVIFDNRRFPSPVTYYPNSFLLYTYGKTLLTPGQRIGYIALTPNMPYREQVRQAVFMSQLITGWAFPNALLQHALEDLEKLSIDMPHLQAKRDRMVGALREMGYELHVPEGTFYLLVRSPLEDDRAFTELLAEQKVLCMPGSVFHMPGYFRISLTANDTMIERALPGFEKAIQKVNMGVGN